MQHMCYICHFFSVILSMYYSINMNQHMSPEQMLQSCFIFTYVTERIALIVRLRLYLTNISTYHTFFYALGRDCDW
jgi:hypothetical protein